MDTEGVGDSGLRQGEADIEYPNYTEDRELTASFLREHTILIPITPTTDTTDHLEEPTSQGHYRTSPYLPLLQKIKDRNFSTPPILEIPLDELIKWDSIRGSDLSTRIIQNTLRYRDLICAVADEMLDELRVSEDVIMSRDSIDVLAEQRRENLRRREEMQEQRVETGAQIGTTASNQPSQTLEEAFPPLLMRRYELRVLPRGRSFTPSGGFATEPPLEGLPLRHVRSRSMGQLVTITGMIVRTSDVKPNCVVATYTCDACGAEIYQEVSNQREFLPHRKCPAPECPGNGDTLFLQTRGSKFVKFQEWKIQELPNQVPIGHVPRSMSIHARGELTRLATPGDVVTVDGVFLPMRAEGGYRAMKGGLVVTTYLEAMNVIVHKRSFDLSSQDEEMEEKIMQIASGDDPMQRLLQSIAPEIYGHEDIKRALLLQLVGGGERKLPDGLRIRGDINICLMGDPGVAKSQLLKHVATIAPRGVYTTGRGSSGVGLTAAVTKDSITNEMALEGGALVLADRGICCIDEFDKMDDSDRTAIHEVMEQQTVSIAKAGIVATLNARAAVLAAANPLYGRYHRKKSLSENVNLPNSLLSRFDLLFLVLDKADLDKDMALARHVTFVHQNEGLKEGGEKNNEETTLDDIPTDVDTEEHKPIPSNVLREYISRARQYHPTIPQNVAPYIIEAYVTLRMQESNVDTQGDQTVMTPRQLLSILRLSQALARLRFSEFVAREDVDEAIRLTHMSKASLLDKDYQGDNQNRSDTLSKVFDIIRDYAIASKRQRVEIRVCEAMVIRKGFTVEQFNKCLEEYEALDVIQISSTRTHLDIVGGDSNK